MFFALVGLIAVVVGGFFRMVQDYRRLLEQSRNDRLLIAAQREKLHRWQQYVDRTNLLLHEVRSRAIVMQTKLQQGELAAVESMLSEMSRSEGLRGEVYTRHELLNALLDWAFGKAQAQGIRVQCRIDGVSQSIAMEESDLAGLISNLLENAIEANEWVNPGERRIAFSIKSYRRTMVIECVNPYCIHGKGRHKDNPERHGYGLRRIRRIAETYHGTVDIKAEDGLYTVIITIALAEEETATTIK